MIIKIDTESSTESTKVATAIHLSKNRGVVSNKVRIENNDGVSEGQSYNDTESTPQDNDTNITKLFDKDNNLVSHPVYQGMYINKISINILSKYSTDAQLCIFTDNAFFKSFSIGDVIGEIDVDLLNGEDIPSDETISQFTTTSGFIAFKTSNGFKPQFLNFGSYENPTYIHIKIVGNDNASASSIIKCELRHV